MTTDWKEAIGMEEALEEELLSSAASFTTSESIVDGNFSRSEVIEIAEYSLDFLAGLAMPTIFEYLFPPVLQAAWKLLVDCVKKEKGDDRIALGIPRGHGKTTLIKLFVLFIILFTDRKFILILSETSTKAEHILSDVMDMLNEPNIKNLFGDWRLGMEMDRQDVKKFGFRGRNIILVALGSGGSLRGMNIKNERPDVMVYDDIQSKENSQSPLQADGLEDWLISTAMKAKSPKRCLAIFAGNMFPGKHSILKKLKNNKLWTKFISGAILMDGSVLWPELRSLQSLIDELNNDISMGHPEVFFSEVMNDTEVGINNKVDLTSIKQWPFSENELPQGKFILIDPSGSKTGSDDTAIGYFEVFDGVPGLKEVIEEQLSPGNTILRVLLLALKTGTRLIGCEATAYQASLLYWFNEKCKDYNLTGFEFVEVHTNAVSKNARIIDMLKQLPTGEILIHGDVRNHVVNQIVNWNPLKRDNTDGVLDLLAYCIQMMDKYSYLMSTETNLEIIEAQSSKVVEGNWAF